MIDVRGDMHSLGGSTGVFESQCYAGWIHSRAYGTGDWPVSAAERYQDETRRQWVSKLPRLEMV